MRFLRTEDVCESLRISRGTLVRWVAQGAFPAPVRLGGPNGRSLRWREDTIRSWLDKREPSVPAFAEAEAASLQA